MPTANQVKHGRKVAVLYLPVSLETLISFGFKGSTLMEIDNMVHCFPDCNAIEIYHSYDMRDHYPFPEDYNIAIYQIRNFSSISGFHFRIGERLDCELNEKRRLQNNDTNK